MTTTALFPLGQIVATPAALAALEATGTNPAALLRRHLAGDWGDVDTEDRQTNDIGVREGTRLVSSYRLSDGEKIWVITESDRSATTILLPDDY